MIQTIKVAVAGFYRYINMYLFEDRLYLKFRYNKSLLEEVKALRGARWHPDTENFPSEVQKLLACDKCWSVENCERNWISLRYLQGENPFKIYDCEIKAVPARPRLDFNNQTIIPYPHQCLMTGHQLGFRCVITAAEMGVGKTLSAIMTMEYAENTAKNDFWYVSTRSGLMATIDELKYWRAKVIPMLFTYEDLVKTLRVSPNIPPPKLVVFDESVALKNIAAQRTQAALYLSQRMRSAHKDPYIIEMCGAPAPQDPTDWWSQCEIAAPGFLREGDPNKFAARLCFTTTEENTTTGGYYRKRLAWKDNTDKCGVCGILMKEHTLIDDHTWVPSKDEIEFLGRRIRGVVLTIRKEDVMAWLPKKIYREIQVITPPSTLRAAKLIAGRSIAVIQKLVLLRMLSDGFKYTEVESEQTKTCPSCNGTAEIQDYDPLTDQISSVMCPQCKGSRQVHLVVRDTEYGPCAKDDALRDLVEECETTGRIVVYAGFTGSVDRCVNVITALGWDVIRADGRGWHAFGPHSGGMQSGKWLEIFQRGHRDFPRVAFVGQAGAAGTGLTLTASQMIVYFSNDFDANHRIQSEDRIHRPGCTGAIIVDLFNLPTDRQVATALKNKRDLQQLVLDASLFNEA